MKPVLGTRINPARARQLGCVYSNLFNERAGTIVKDGVSNRAFDFDATNTPSWTPEGVEFQANQVHINAFILNQILPAGTDGTILFGYKVGTLATYSYLFSTDGYAEFSWYVRSTGAMRVLMTTTIFDTTVVNFQNGDVIGFSWKHIGTSIYVWWYKNGIQVATANAVKTFASSSQQFNIGGRPDAADRYAGGIFKWFHVFNRALSSQEVAKVSANPYWMYQRTPIWMFDYTAGGGGTVYNESISESASISDSPSNIASLLAAIAESNAITDSTSNLAVLLNAIAEISTVSDTVSNASTLIAAISEATTVTDLFNALLTFNNSISESANISDTLSALATFVCAITDDTAITDLITSFLGNILEISESVNVTDNMSSIATLLANISESAAATDNLSAIATLLANVAEATTIADIFNAGNIYLETVNETVTITDLIQLVTIIIDLAHGILFKKDLPKSVIVKAKLPDSILFEKELPDGIIFKVN